MAEPQFILANGDLVASPDAHATAQYRDMGLHEAGADDIRVDHLKQQYSGWQYTAPAFLAGAVQGALPGATSAVVHGIQAVSPEAGQGAADYLQGISAANPMASTFGQLAGIAGGAVATGGANVEATAASLLARGAVYGAAGAADQQALDHIQSPEGSEKVLAHLGLSALLGGALTYGGAKLADKVATGVLAKTGKNLVASGEASQLEQVVSQKMQQRMAENGGVPAGLKDYLETNKLLDKTPKEIKLFLTDRAKVTQSVIQEARGSIKATLTPQEQLAFAQELRTQVSGNDSLVKRAMGLFTQKKPVDLANLHDMRMNIDKAINYNDPTSLISQRMQGARKMVENRINTLLGNAANMGAEQADQANRWFNANQEYNIINKLKDAYKVGAPSSKGGFLNGVSRMLNKTGPVVAAAGALHGNFGPAALYGTAKAVHWGAQAVDGSGARILSGLGKTMEQFDEHVVQTVAEKLGARGVTAAKAVPLSLSLAHYNSLAAALNIGQQNPTDTIPRMADHLEQRGVPGEVVDAGSAPAVRATQYLQSLVPPNPHIGVSVAPIPHDPTVKEKLAVIEAAKAVDNPLWALQNPTPQRIAAVRAAYPILAGKVSTMVAQHAATRPQMTSQQRNWASMITGIPAHPLAAPRLQAAMATSVQATEQKRQQELQQARKAGQNGLAGSMGQ